MAEIAASFAPRNASQQAIRAGDGRHRVADVKFAVPSIACECGWESRASDIVLAWKEHAGRRGAGRP